MDKAKLVEKYSKVGKEMLWGYSHGEAEDGMVEYIGNQLEKGRITEEEEDFLVGCIPGEEGEPFGKDFLEGKE